MKNADPVMQDVLQAKEANAKKHQSLAGYLAFLRKQSKQKHPGGRVPAAGNAKVKRQFQID